MDIVIPHSLDQIELLKLPEILNTNVNIFGLISNQKNIIWNWSDDLESLLKKFELNEPIDLDNNNGYFISFWKNVCIFSTGFRWNHFLTDMQFRTISRNLTFNLLKILNPYKKNIFKSIYLSYVHVDDKNDTFYKLLEKNQNFIELENYCISKLGIPNSIHLTFNQYFLNDHRDISQSIYFIDDFMDYFLDLSI